jgi:hypothetical protein
LDEDREYIGDCLFRDPYLAMQRETDLDTDPFAVELGMFVETSLHVGSSIVS